MKLAAKLALVLAGLAVSACSEIEEGTSDGYEPATLAPIGGTDLKRVTFTAEGARRTGLRTAAVRQSGKHRQVPYAALVYDGAGRAYVYTNPDRLTFVRARVQVAHVERDHVLLLNGPAAGSKVVTTGAAQVYGTELEIAGGH